MKTFQILALATVAIGAVALATPAQARDRDHHHHDGRYYRHWDGHRHGRVVVYSTPRYYSRSYYRPYYYDDYYSPGYTYYRPYSYYSGPSVSFAFGGRGYRHWHHHR